jgi:hypothetical protein
MPRTIHATMLGKLNDTAVHAWRFFFSLAVAPGADERLWTGTGPIVWNGQTWLGIGRILFMSDYRVGMMGNLSNWSLTLGAADPARLVRYFADTVENRTITFYAAIVNETTGALLPDPVMVVQRRMHVGAYTRSKDEYSLTIEGESPMATMRRGGHRVRAHADQLEWAKDLGEGLDECFVDVTNQTTANLNKNNWVAKSG